MANSSQSLGLQECIPSVLVGSCFSGTAYQYKVKKNINKTSGHGQYPTNRYFSHKPGMKVQLR